MNNKFFVCLKTNFKFMYYGYKIDYANFLSIAEYIRIKSTDFTKQNIYTKLSIKMHIIYYACLSTFSS